MATIPQESMSVQAFLEWEGGQTEKHEFYRGRAHAMAGASENHGGITPALAELCRRQLRGKPCRYRGADTKVLVADLGATFLPDGLIACPPNFVSRPAGLIDNPTAIFEVLSPSTKDRDREGKFDAYALLPSLKDYVLIASEIARVEVFSRQPDGSWNLRVFLPGTTAEIPSVGVELSLDELYEDVSFEE